MDSTQTGVQTCGSPAIPQPQVPEATCSVRLSERDEAAVLAAAGCYGVHIYRAKNSSAQMASVDAGQPANFENWVDEGGGLARVRYRGASWDARIDGQGGLEDGALLYVEQIEGHTLKVSRQRPA